MTACFFGGMSLYGHSTNRDLTKVGSYMFVGLVSVIVTSLINVFFLKSSVVELGISALLIVIFAGLTAYDVQNIKQMYAETDGEELASKLSVFGALTLYLDFINMFLAILRFFGHNRD